MSDTVNFAVKTEYIWGAAITSLLAAFGGWKMFFSSKIQQIEDMQESVNRIETKLDEHINDESGKLHTIHKSLNHLTSRIDRVFEVK